MADISAAAINQDWVENSMTQPVPEDGSQTRLKLPYENDELLLDDAPITGFGAHAGQHIEGLDHVWIPVQSQTVSRAWGKGEVKRIEKIGYIGEEFMVTIDYGGGLRCVNGELGSVSVAKGQQVSFGDPIGIVRDLYGLPGIGEIEIYCSDSKRSTGTITSNDDNKSIAVSPFDYLEVSDRVRLEKLYEERIVRPYLIAKKFDGESWSPVEPFLTNRIMVHEPNKITGEWFLVNQQYNGQDLSLMSFIESRNKYHTGTAFHLRAETFENFEVKVYIDGDYESDYAGQQGKLVLHDRRDKQTYYALFEINENVGRDVFGQPRAQMKFEWSSQPVTAFSDKARTYQERSLINPRNEAAQLGNWIKVK